VESIVHILSYLDYKELFVTSKVCHSWLEVSNDDALWTPFLQQQFLIKNSTPSSTFCKDLYKNMYLEWKDYISCYTRVKGVWNELEGWLGQHAPGILASIEEGATTANLDSLIAYLRKEGAQESDIKEYLCSLRIHNGQGISTAGLFGVVQVYDYYTNVHLLGVRAILGVMPSLLQRGCAWVRNCLIIAAEPNVFCFYFIVIKDFTYDNQNFKAGMILHHTHSLSYPLREATSYCEWIEHYTRDLISKRYDVIGGDINRFSTRAEEGSDVTTCDVRIRANALFLACRSDIRPSTKIGNFFYSYRIKISMDSAVPAKKACKLRSRCWVITDGNGKKQVVRGAGVIGCSPVINPGTVYEYCSCCPLNTPHGTMEGYFEFEDLLTQEVFKVDIGRFVLSMQ